MVKITHNILEKCAIFHIITFSDITTGIVLFPLLWHFVRVLQIFSINKPIWREEMCRLRKHSQR